MPPDCVNPPFKARVEPLLKSINPVEVSELPPPSVSVPPVEYPFAVLNLIGPVQVKSACCILKVPADSPSAGAELSMVKSVAAEPRVKVFPASCTEPTVNGEFLVMVVSAFIFSTVLLPVDASSRVRLPATSNVPFEIFKKFAPDNDVFAFVCSKIFDLPQFLKLTPHVQHAIWYF